MKLNLAKYNLIWLIKWLTLASLHGKKLAKSKVKYMYWWDEPNCFTCLCNL